jgi:hypothetical protein
MMVDPLSYALMLMLRDLWSWAKRTVNRLRANWR